MLAWVVRVPHRHCSLEFYEKVGAKFQDSEFDFQYGENLHPSYEKYLRGRNLISWRGTDVDGDAGVHVKNDTVMCVESSLVVVCDDDNRSLWS